MKIAIVNKRNKRIGTHEFTEFDIEAVNENGTKYEVNNLTVDGFNASDLTCKSSAAFFNEDGAIDGTAYEVEVNHYTAQTDFLVNLSGRIEVSNSIGKHVVSLESLKEYSKTIEATSDTLAIEAFSEVAEFMKEEHDMENLLDYLSSAVYFFETSCECTYNEAMRQTVMILIITYAELKNEIEEDYKRIESYLSKNENEHLGFMYEIVEMARTGSLMDKAIVHEALSL